MTISTLDLPNGNTYPYAIELPWANSAFAIEAIIGLFGQPVMFGRWVKKPNPYRPDKCLIGFRDEYDRSLALLTIG